VILYNYIGLLAIGNILFSVAVLIHFFAELLKIFTFILLYQLSNQSAPYDHLHLHQPFEGSVLD